MDDSRMTMGVVVPAHGNSSGAPVEVAITTSRTKREHREMLTILKRIVRTYMPHDGSVATDAIREAREVLARIEAP